METNGMPCPEATRKSSFKQWLKIGRLGSVLRSTRENRRKTLQISNPIPLAQAQSPQITPARTSSAPPSSSKELYPPRNESRRGGSVAKHVISASRTESLFTDADCIGSVLQDPNYVSLTSLSPNPEIMHDTGKNLFNDEEEHLPKDISRFGSHMRNGRSISNALSTLKRRSGLSSSKVDNSNVDYGSFNQDNIGDLRLGDVTSISAFVQSAIDSQIHTAPASSIFDSSEVHTDHHGEVRKDDGEPIASVISEEDSQSLAKSASKYVSLQPTISQESSPLASPRPFYMDDYERGEYMVISGLHPRPASLKKSWTNKIPNRTSTSGSLESPLVRNRESRKIRSVSFPGVSSKPEISKSLGMLSSESRMLELEYRLSELEKRLNRNKDSSRLPSTHVGENQASRRLNSTFTCEPHDFRAYASEEESVSGKIEPVLHDLQKYDLIIIESSVRCIQRAWRAYVARRQRFQGSDTKSAVAVTPCYIRAQEIGNGEIVDSKPRSSTSKMNLPKDDHIVTKADDSLSSAEDIRAQPLNSVSALIALVKIERRKRRRLEAQVESLQEQVTILLDKKFESLGDGPSTILGNATNRKVELETGIPTPDNSSRRSRQFDGYLERDIFSEFDSLPSHLSSDPHMSIDGNTETRVVDTASDADDDSSDVFQTPVDETVSFLQEASSDEEDVERTLSLSQVTYGDIISDCRAFAVKA